MVQENGKRKKPNILVTGTPGTGKTTMSTALAEATQLNHINIGDLVRDKNLHDGWDDELDSYILNEDLVSYQFIYLRSFLYCYVCCRYRCIRYIQI
jgi:adenylate kinase